MFTGRKLPLTLSFVVLVGLALTVSCKGFFTDPTLNTIAIQPPTPQVEVDHSIALQAWGTYSDNTRKQIKSGVAWTTSDHNIVDIDPNTGQITGKGNGGTATITAAAQGLSATATATSFLGNVSNLQVCTGVFNTNGTGCPAATWSVSGQGGGTQDYYARVTTDTGPVDVTTVATWDVTPATTAGGVTCDGTATPAVCTVLPQTLPAGGTIYTITVAYPNLPSVTANIQVN